MVDFKRKPEIVWTMPQVLSDAEQLQARQNMGAAALVSLAASFESRSPNYDWGAGEVCTYAGKLWMFDRNHSGSWDAADVHETNILEVLSTMSSNERPTTVLSAPIYIGGDPTDLNIYEYQNAGSNQVINFTARCILSLTPNAGATLNPVLFNPEKTLVIKRARIVTPGSVGLGAANGKKCAVLYMLTAQGLGEPLYSVGDYFALQFSAYNEWALMNISLDSPYISSGSSLGMAIEVSHDGNSSYMTVDDYNLQSVYVGKKLQAYLEIEVESEGIA